MLESYLQQKIVRYAKESGWLVRKLTTPSNRAAPDLMLIRSGKVLFIEVKQKGKKPRKNQVIEFERYRQHGAEVVVMDDYDSFVNYINNYK